MECGMIECALNNDTHSKNVYDKKSRSITSSIGNKFSFSDHYESVAVIKHYNSIIEIDFPITSIHNNFMFLLKMQLAFI